MITLLGVALSLSIAGNELKHNILYKDLFGW